MYGFPPLAPERLLRQGLTPVPKVESRTLFRGVSRERIEDRPQAPGSGCLGAINSCLLVC